MPRIHLLTGQLAVQIIVGSLKLLASLPLQKWEDTFICMDRILKILLVDSKESFLKNQRYLFFMPLWLGVGQEKGRNICFWNLIYIFLSLYLKSYPWSSWLSQSEDSVKLLTHGDSLSDWTCSRRTRRISANPNSDSAQGEPRGLTLSWTKPQVQSKDGFLSGPHVSSPLSCDDLCV